MRPDALPPGLQKLAEEAQRLGDRPAISVASMPDIGRALGDLRRGLKITQATLADRAEVGRHWIVEMEQGKPTLEIGLVLRVLEIFGLEVWLRPYLPAPPWIADARAEAKLRTAEVAANRQRVRHIRRAAARAKRLAANAPKVWPRLD